MHRVGLTRARSLGIAMLWIGASAVGALALPAGRPAAGPWPRVWRAQSETAATGVFHGVGVVTAIQPGGGALTLDHEDIQGLMPAMEMMYRVRSPDLARGLSVGDRIGFDIDAKSFTILAVTRFGPAK